MHGSSPPKSTSQTASRLVQLFQHSLWFSQKESDHATSITYAESRVLLCTAIKAWKWKCTALASYNESAPPMGDLAPPNKLLLGHPQMVYRLVQPFLQRSCSWPTERQTDQYTSSSGLHLVLQAVLSILLAYSTCLQCFDTKVTGHCIQKSLHLLPAYPGCPGKRVLNGCSSCC